MLRRNGCGRHRRLYATARKYNDSRHVYNSEPLIIPSYVYEHRHTDRGGPMDFRNSAAPRGRPVLRDRGQTVTLGSD